MELIRYFYSNTKFIGLQYIIALFMTLAVVLSQGKQYASSDTYTQIRLHLHYEFRQSSIHLSIDPTTTTTTSIHAPH